MNIIAPLSVIDSTGFLFAALACYYSSSDHLWHFDVQGKTPLRYAIQNKASDVTEFAKVIFHVLLDRRVEWLGLDSCGERALSKN
mmetsp:Transcript_24493/g.60002  ORF Transcript_24493/g.60002 Transcript_24493/m.60002 type:complete len:85 (-) Transcript_24493:1063-1317(-)